ICDMTAVTAWLILRAQTGDRDARDVASSRAQQTRRRCNAERCACCRPSRSSENGEEYSQTIMFDSGVSRRSFARAIAAGAAIASLPQFVARAAGEKKGALVRLSANENPYGPSPAAMHAMTEALMDAPRYPDELTELMCADVARFHGVTCDEVLLGDGSSDILRLVASVYAGPKKKIVMADPTFEAIGHYAQRNGADVIKVPLDAGFAHDLDKMRDADVVYICNPNNP